MPPPPVSGELRAALYLDDVGVALDRAARYLARGRAHYDESEEARDAARYVIDHVTQTLLETHRHDPEFRDRHPDVPWGRIQGMHVRITKTYWDIDDDLVWDVLENHLPGLREELAEEVEDARETIRLRDLSREDVVEAKREADRGRRDERTR